MPGAARTTSSSSAGSSSSLLMPARIAPADRMWRASRRVSTSVTATTPAPASSASSPPDARQLECMRLAERMMNPATWTADASASSGVVP